MYKCPKCGSLTIAIKRRPNGNSTCSCGFKAPTSEFAYAGSKPNNVQPINDSPYFQEGKLHDDINDVIRGYIGKIGTASVVGVLEILKHGLIDAHGE